VGYAIELKRPVTGGRSTHWFDQIFVGPDNSSDTDSALKLAESQFMVQKYPEPAGSSLWGGEATIKIANHDGALEEVIHAKHVLVVRKDLNDGPPLFTAREIWIWTGDMEQSREIDDLITEAEVYAANE